MLRLKATQDKVGVMCLAGPSENDNEDIVAPGNVRAGATRLQKGWRFLFDEDDDGDADKHAVDSKVPEFVCTQKFHKNFY